MAATILRATHRSRDEAALFWCRYCRPSISSRMRQHSFCCVARGRGPSLCLETRECKTTRSPYVGTTIRSLRKSAVNVPQPMAAQRNYSNGHTQIAK
ncbi:hypothetical protein RLO149_c022950 [Roseobacter litoralis Och 149]|uniref:Uncharacterized protein n=1 Tax=Roseobacter litoralis (strain ATCC 49566 / DSM 6996 / JCM 21268 / NBRC 15278 / OCh 149) TaxID=391595 RepID=F7ZAS1_ROSLO|nr:hypothetical protein RLO149_c022950 [Roseobacter litoralis Och 149]